jgi:hypothetical protein
MKQVEDQNPEILDSCLIDYDNPVEQYERYRNIPKSDLRQIAFLKELDAGNVKRAALIKPKNNIRNLPVAMRDYLDNNYDEYHDYERELKSLRKYMTALRENRSKELHRSSSAQKRRLSPRPPSSFSDEEYID